MFYRGGFTDSPPSPVSRESPGTKKQKPKHRPALERPCGEAEADRGAGRVEPEPFPFLEPPGKQRQFRGTPPPGSPVAIVFFACTLPQTPATVTEKSSNLAILRGKLQPLKGISSGPCFVGKPRGTRISLAGLFPF